jgi:hypothetical protein
VTAHIIHQKILNRALNRIKQSPEEEQERELDRPERGPEHHVDSELELQKQGCPAHESGSDWLKLGANIRKFIHGGYGNLAEDGSDDMTKHGEKDPIVIDEESLAALVLDAGSEYDEACRECYSNPHNRLEVMSKDLVAFWSWGKNRILPRVQLLILSGAGLEPCPAPSMC